MIERTAIHHVGVIRAWYAARADHRNDPALPELRRPDALFFQKQHILHKRRSQKTFHCAQAKQATLRQRSRRRRQRKRRGA